jgi:hypothetical protein
VHHIVPTDPVARLTRCVPAGSTLYLANGICVAVVFPGESHSESWQATKAAALR